MDLQKNIGTRRIIIYLVILIVACTAFNDNKVMAQVGESSKQSTSLIAKGTKPVLVSRQFTFTEGPAVDKKGNIFFTDQPNNKIWEYSIDGKLSVFMDSTGRSNGLYFDAKGNLISCADEHDQLWSIAPDKKVTVLVTGYNGHLLNGPNDLWIAPTGAIYLSDPYFQRDYWTRKSADPALAGEKLYYLPAGGKELLMADSTVTKPNGLVGTPDGKYLYVADMGPWKTYRYNINPDGSLTNKQLFADEGSDGMTIDERGNIYLANNGISIYNPAGKKIEHIPIPEKWSANICFGGRDRKTLFITASQGVYTVRMNVRGVE